MEAAIPIQTVATGEELKVKLTEAGAEVEIA